MRKSRNTMRQSRARRGSRRHMRKNKTMKRGGGLGFNFDTMKTLTRAGLDHAVKTGINHAASNGRISFSNPKGVKIPPNLFGFAKSSLGKYTNNSPGMSFAERIRHGAEGFNSAIKSGKFDSVIKNPELNAAFNNGLNRMNKSKLADNVFNRRKFD